MMTRDQHGHHRRRSPESERRRRKERRSSREQVLSHMQHMPEPDRYHANTMRQEPSSHDYYDSQSAAQRSSYYAHPQPPPSQSHYGQSRARSSSSNSSSSSTSSSLLNISRHDRPFGLKTFFTAASERRKRRLRKQRSRRMFRFSNGSSSSDLSDMAYGKGYIDRMRNRDFTPPGPIRRREGSDSGTRPALPKRAQTDEEIIELGRKFAEIARQQNKEDQRRAGRHKPSALLGAAAALSAYKKTSGSGRSDRGLGSSKHSRHDSSDESEWESASEDESSSDDDGLVYGSAVHLPTGGHQPIHISSPPPSSRPGEYEKMLQHKPSIVDPKLFGPVNSLRGHVNTPCGFDKVDRRTVTEGHQRPLPADGSASVSQSETVLFEGRPLQNVYPVPTSDPNIYKTSRGSIVSLERDSRDRPAPVPIQQPQPIVPVSSKVYDTTETDARYSRKSSSSGTALAGAAAAGLAGAAIASVLSDRKDKEDRRDDRDSRRERESEKERDRERDEKRRSKRSDPKYAESVYSESRHGDERDEKRRSKRSDDKYAGSKYTDSQIGDDRDEKRRSRRSDDKSTNERDEKRKSRDDDRDLERAERRREKERLKELERGALKQTTDVAPEPPRDFSNPIVDRDYGILYGREYRGLDRREDRKREQERREEKQRLEEMERQEELERRKEKSLASRSSDADTYRRIEDLNDPSARGPIDPFQFQVANDAFATPQRPLTPNVFTVSREPDFSSLGDDYDRPMERLSRKDSYERELRDAEAIYDSTRTATAPIAAGAIAAATAAIGMEHRRGRSTSRGGDESSRVREDHKDVVQDVANILYRRDMLARQAAEDRSRSASPDQSIVDKWTSESGSTKPEITTPPAKDVPKPRSPYDGPDADVRIDRILSPEDLPLRHNGRPFKSRDPSAERDRPMLNIVRPTPVPTPQPEQQQTREELREEASEERESKRESKKKKKKNPPLVEQYRSTDDVVYNTRSEVSSTPSTPTSKGVTWGENETRRYVVESPERGNDEYSGARVVVPAEKLKSKSGKKSGWGILASAIAGTGAAAAASALSDSGKDKDADETSSHISTSSKRSRDRDSPREKEIDRFETSSNISSSSRKSKDRDSPKGRDRDEISSSISSDSKKPRDRDSADLNDKIRDDIASNLSSSSRRSRDRDAVDKDGAASIVSSSSRKSRGSPPKEQRSSFIPWDEAEDPPVPGPKPSGLRGSPMPGSFAEDLAFTATIAAGLQDSGFDPNLVIDDAKYHRRDSPPNTTDKPAFYQSPFSESVSDVNKFHVAPTGSTVGSEPGFILGEIPETPQDERDLPLDSVDLSKLSKKERKKLEKAAKRASVDNYDLKSQIVVEEEPEAFQAASEPIVKDEDDWASITKLSKKEQKKRDKAARAKVLQEEESALSTPRDSEPETPQQPQDGDEWASSSKLSKKEKKKLEKAAKAKSLQEDEVIEVSTPQEPESQAIEPVFDEWEDTYSSKKSKKDKKKDKLVFADEDTRGFNDSTDSKVSVPVDSFRDLQEEAQLAQPAQPEDDWSASSKKSKKKSKRDSVAFDWTTEPALPTGEASQGDGQKEASIGQPEDAWSTSSKKSKKKSKRESEIFDTALHTPLPAEEAPREIVEESTYAQPEDDWATPTSKKSKKKSKRNSEIYESPSQSIILPEVENLRDTQENSSAQPGDDWSISSKKSKKKSKRDSEIYDSPSRSAAQSEVGETSYKPGDPENTAFLDDEWDTPKKSKKHTKQDSFATDNTDWTNVPSIVSESMIKSQSTDDFSVAEAAGGDDWEVPVKKSKKKSKRDSTNYDSPSQTPNEQNDVVESPKALTDSFADLRSDRSRDPVDDEWNESKKSKKSKRHSYHESLPETDNGSESSEKRSKKEKRRSLPGGFPDDFDVPDQGDPPDRGRGDYPFVDNDVSSVVSVPLRDRSEKRKSRSRFDDLDDDAKSIASAPGGSRKRDSKSEKDKEKRNSTGSGFFDRFKSSIGIVDDKDKSSRDDEKKSLKDNADTLGASVGLLGAAAALIKSQMSPTNATDVPSDEKEALSDPITPSRQQSPSPSQRRLSDSIDPEIVEREIRPAIDPQYGDLLPLPPSPPPGSPKTHETDELPALPDSRPETPEHERQLRREMLNKPSHVRRKSANETPTKLKSPSQSAIPLRFGMKGKRPSEPSSPVTRRLTPTSSPIATPVESLSAGKGRPTRPTSWDSSREFKPLYLVERTSRDSVIPLVQHTEDLPQIPESGSSSHASLDPQPEGHEADFPFEYAQTLPRDLPLGLDIPAALAENDDTTHLGSQETTPKARDLPDALVTSPQAEQKLEDLTLPSPTEHRSQGTPKLESIAPMSTDLKDEIPIEENVGLGLMNDVPAGIDAAVALLDDNNLPVDDAKMEAGASDLSPMVSKKSKKGKKGKKNKKALDWEPEPDSTTIATDVTSSSAPQVDLLAEKLQGNDQQEEIKPYIPTPMLEPSTRPPEESSGPALEPESVYATPMDFGVAPADGFAFPEETTKEPEMLSHAQESTDTFSPPVNSEDMQASMADEFTLPAKKSKKKKGKKSQQLEPEPVSQLESDPPLSDDPKSSTAEPATSDDVNTIVAEPTPSNDKPTSHPVIEPQELQEQPVAHLSEDAALSRALEPQPSGQAHAIPLGDQLTTGTSELETANVEIESSDRPAAPINEDTQVESHATEISNPKSVEGELPEDVVVAESMQPDSATPAGLDLGGPPQDPLPTNDPDKIAIVNSAQPPSPWAVEAKQDLEVVPDVVPSVADENTFEPMTELQQEVSGKKKKKNNKKDKKRQSTSWETEPEVPAEVPLPHDPGVIEAPSEPLSASNETQPSIQPEMETAPDDIWSAPIKSGKKGKKGKKNRQSVVLDDSNPLPLSETPADSPVIHEDTKELPTESHAEHEALSTSWADEVEENLPAASEPEPEIVQQSASSQLKETDPEAEFAGSKKKSKKDKKKNRSSVPFDDTPGEVPAEQSHIETASEEPVHEAPIHSTSDSVSSFNETRDIPEAEPEKDVTDDLWPTSSKKSKKKKKKGQLVQWEETPSASKVPQTLQESNAPNLELPASTSEEQVRDSLATQEPGDTHDKPHPTADEVSDSNVDFSQEQAPREVANEPDAIAAVASLDDSQALSESNVPANVTEDFAPADHAVGQDDETVSTTLQDEAPVSQAQVEAQNVPETGLLQPSVDDETAPGETVSASVGQEPLIVNETTGGDEHIKIDDVPTVIAEEEFPLTKKSKKDKKKKKRQSKIDDLLDSGASTPKEETSLDTAETETLPQTTTQDEAQSRELSIDDQPLDKNESAEPGDQQQDDEWANFSSKKSKKDKKKKKKGSQNIEPDPEAEQPVLEDALVEQPSSAITTPAADAVIREPSNPLVKSVPSTLEEPRNEPFEHAAPAADLTGAATQPEQETFQDAREIPVDGLRSTSHDIDQPAGVYPEAHAELAEHSGSPREPADASHDPFEEVLPEVQLKADNGISPPEDLVVAEDDAFTAATSKKSKKKKKRQSLAQESEATGTSSFDTVTPDEPQASPAPEELPSTSVEQFTDAQMYEPGEISSQNPPDKIELQESHEPTERSLINPDEAFAAQPTSPFTDNHVGEMEPSVQQDQPIPESQQQEAPSALPDQLLSLEPSGQQISNPELIEDIKHITHPAEDETGLPSVIQVGETLPESTPGILVKDATDEQAAHDEPSSTHSAQDAQEPGMPVPEPQPTTEAAPAEEDQGDFFVAPKSKKDKKKKKRAGQNFQEDPVTTPAEDSPTTASQSQDPEPDSKQDLTEDPSQQSKELQVEDTVVSTPVLEDDSLLAVEPEFSTAKKSKKDKKKKKQAVSSWTDDLPQDQTEVSQAEGAADIEASAEQLSSDLPLLVEEPGNETPLETETLKDDDFTEFTSSKKSKKDKKKKKQLTSPWEEEVQQEQTPTSDEPSHANTNPPLEEAFGAEAPTPTASAPIEDILEFIPAKKSKKDKKKKNNSSWEPEEPQETEALPEESRETGPLDAGPSKDFGAAFVDSPNIPDATANDDDFSGFTSGKKSKKDKKKKRASAWEPEPEPEAASEGLTTISREDPVEPANEAPLALASHAAEPVLDELLTQAPQEHGDVQLEHPSITQDTDTAQDLHSRIPEDLQPQREENEANEVADEPSHSLKDLEKALPSILIDAPHDTELAPEQKEATGEQQIETNADDQLLTEPSTVFATPLGELTPQEDPRDLPEAAQISSSAQEVPEPENELFVTKKSKKDKKKKKQASQIEDLERESSVPPTTESPLEDQSVQVETQPIDDNALLDTQEAKPEDAFPEFISTKKSKKDKKKKKAGQAQDWEAETEPEPESAFMTPLEEPDKQMERQLPAVSTGLSPVDEFPVDAESSPTAQPDPAVVDAMTAETVPESSTAQSEDIFSEIPSGKKSKKDKKKKRASQLQDWEADSSPTTPAHEEPVAAPAADVNTDDVEQIPDQGASDPKEPEASELIVPGFTTGKKSKKDKKKAKAALTPDVQEPDSFYTPMEETQQALEIAEDVTMPEPAIEPTADDLSTSKDVEPEDEFPEFTSSKKSKKDKKKKKGLQFDWEEPTQAVAESDETQPTQNISPADPLVDTPGETKDVVFENPDMSTETQAEEEFPEFVSTKKSKKDKKKAKMAAALAAIADAEPESRALDSPSAEANSSLPAEPEPVITSEAPISSPILESTAYHGVEVAEARAEPIDDLKVPDPTPASSLEPPAEAEAAATSDLKGLESIPTDESTAIVPDDTDEAVRDRSAPEDEHITHVPTMTSADALIDQTQDQATEFPEFSVKKSKKDKKKAKKAKAAEPLPWEDDALATGAQSPLVDEVPSQPDTQDLLLPAPETEVGLAEMPQEPPTLEPKPEEVPANVTDSQLPVDIAPEAPFEHDPPASKDIEVDEFPITRKKSKKDKKKAKAAALLVSEPTSGTETPMAQDEQAINLSAPESLAAVEPQESTTHEVAEDVPTPEPLQLNIGGKLVSEEPESSQQATDDWPEFSSKKTKKDKKKKSKSTADFETERTPEVLDPSFEEPELRRDLDVAIPETQANDSSITEQPIVEEPQEVMPADDEWPQYSTKKSKKDKKKRKTTGILESEPASGTQTPLAQEAPMEESFSPAIPSAEPTVEEDITSSAPIDVQVSSAPVEDDDWSNFTAKKSKKDKKGKKKGKSSGSATPAEASVPLVEASRAALSEEPATIESSKAKDVWDDDSFFKPRESSSPSYRDEGFSPSGIVEEAAPATPVRSMDPFTSAISPAVDVDLSPAQLTSHVDHDKPFDQTTQPGKKVRTNTFLGDTEIPEPISAIEPEPASHGSDILVSQDSSDAKVENTDVHAVPETTIEDPASQPDQAPSPAPTAREFAADYLDPEHSKHSHRQNDKAAVDWTSDYSSPLPQATSERDIAVSYLESHSRNIGDLSFETELLKSDPLVVPPSEVKAAYNHENQAVTGDNDHRGVVVAEYPPKIDQPSPKMSGFAAQDSFYSVSGDFAEPLSAKSQEFGKSPMSKDEIEKEDNANDADALAAAAALTGGVAMLASKFGGAKKVKVKKGKKSKYVDKRQPKEDDIFDDPMLWESSERKIMTGNDGGRLDMDTGDFWDVQDETEETPEVQPEKLASKETELGGASTEGGQVRGITHGIIANSSELPESPIVGHNERNTGPTQPEMPLRVSAEHLETPGMDSASELIKDIDELDTTEPIPSRGTDASPVQDIRTQMISPNRDFTDWARSSIMSARNLPPVEEEPNEEFEDLPKPQSDDLLRTPEINRDSGFVAESPLPVRQSLFDDESGNRDSGVHMKDWHEETGAQALREVTEAQPDTPRDVQTPKTEEKRGKKSHLSEETPRLGTPSRSLGDTSPDPEKRSRSHAAGPKTPRSAKYESLNTGASPALTPHAFGQQKSFSDKMVNREGSKEENAGTTATTTTTTTTTPRSVRSTSNTSVTRLRTPEPLNLRPDSPGSIRSSGTSTPPLRRVDKRMSGDLRSLSQHNNNGSVTSLHSHHSPHSRLASPVPYPGARPASALSSSTPAPAPSASPSPSALATAKAKGGSDKDVLAALQVERRRQTATATSTSSTPVANEGRVRAKDMTDVYDGVGEGRIGSPRSPTRPHSMRRRQSMQVLELESKVEQLIAENRALTEARLQADVNVNQRAAVTITERDTLIEQLRSSLEEYKREVQRLKEVNEGLQSANSQLAAQHSERYSHLEHQHASASSTLQDKDAEIQQLRDELEATKQQVREMQQQILATKPADADFLRLRDEDYFDNRCQQLCAHVQQWVLRFSKFSDMRASRLTSEINDVKIVDRLDNTVLDGSDVDDYLSDRVKRRDVFMSMTMHMVWEYVFTRYLFGMDREQRQKLKALEKLLSDVGPPHAVRQWRAVTLTLLSRRPAFGDQRNDDTEAVVQAILETLSKILPPPSNMENQIQSQLRRVLREAVDLSIEMRTQRAEYMMLPPLQPEYDGNGDLAETVAFNAALMNERSGGSTSNEDLEANGAVVRMVLFPLVIKKGDDNGLGDDEIVVCPAQVLVQRSSHRSIRMVTPSSEFGGGAPLSRGATPSAGFKSAVSLPMSPAPEGADSHMEGAF